MPGGHDNGNRQAAPLHLLDQLHPVHPWHAQVGNDNAIVILAQGLNGFFAITGDIDFNLGVQLEELLQLPAGRLVILYDQDAPAHVRLLFSRACFHRLVAAVAHGILACMQRLDHDVLAFLDHSLRNLRLVMMDQHGGRRLFFFLWSGAAEC